MEAHVTAEVSVSEKDVNRVESAIRAGKDRDDVFPRLAGLTTLVEGQGVSLTVRFLISKKEGVPVRYIVADDPTDAAAVREVDLQRKYHFSASDLATKICLSGPRSTALRNHLGIDANPECMHIFEFGASHHRRWSDKAWLMMRDALADGLSMEEVWSQSGSKKRNN